MVERRGEGRDSKEKGRKEGKREGFERGGVGRRGGWSDLKQQRRQDGRGRDSKVKRIKEEMRDEIFEGEGQ